ncbi:hypothetical protein [Desulfovibrio psychrotolerans]|uniref:Lipoprotein n=1 Tax=Desulfovibrio psychrotolerans TaxID=415242 RepID=A0A7J0BU75_9BACT|nr:hypothetical protein [Desulfovibrio psychrotolerans]GFM37253.1 lipoprotein [Desulfovibrio psychrotolerans]
MYTPIRRPLAVLALCSLLALAVLLGGCIPQRQAPAVPDVNATAIPLQAPLTVMDGADFAVFTKRFLPELVRRKILDPQGRPVPDTPLLLHGTELPDGEYRPESYGKEIYHRLSLRYMWSAEERETVQDTVTHASLPSSGETVTIDESSLVVVGEFSTDIYKLVALLDWNGDGMRDWLVRYRFKPSVDEPSSSRMLIIEASGPEGMLEAQVIEAVECTPEGCNSYTGTALPAILGYDPTPAGEKMEAAQHAPSDSAGTPLPQ